jgi:Tfp pilus assembly protein PilN
MNGGNLNLAHRPFLNTRPVSRIALALWLLGGLLLLGNVTLFWRYLSGSTEKRADLARMEEQVEHEQQAVSRLEARLAGLDLRQQNEQVEFLNRKIAARTFSWSRLFDRLAEVLPNDVRLILLQPAPIGEDERAGVRAVRGAPLRSDRVPLIIQGESRKDEALLQFVDNLFAHSAFDNPNLTQESRSEETHNRVRFDLLVTYLPGDEGSGDAGETITIEEEPAPRVEEEATPAPQQPEDTEANEAETE